ncbi:hypothetical protein [Haladaptatus sp. W1]|uniref:hypothetical protein n=1 Tax=Haladaptatus sp. W1 TaxID=1897478 RepID=UPI001585E85B|nr:hypothetical protein [Haladaptatus sp. W1]
MAVNHIETLECPLCGATYDLDPVRDAYPNHEGVSGILDAKYDCEAVKETKSRSPDHE